MATYIHTHTHTHTATIYIYIYIYIYIRNVKPFSNSHLKPHNTIK